MPASPRKTLIAGLVTTGVVAIGFIITPADPASFLFFCLAVVIAWVGLRYLLRE